MAGNPVLSAFNRISQDKAIRTFSEKDTEQFEINKAKIRAELSSMRPSLDMIASGSALAILLREGEKKRKQKSIRSLLAETGELVQRVKPCFLMSPLSVSTFLAPDSVHFDVVVFDEASQIFPQDAIGAIYRADQLIVVGDSKQMPPSNFFNATIEAEDNDEETGDVTDFESILDLCSTSMQQLRLRWHYRSRYEQLITFSNKNFYDSDLVTFPSSKVDAPGIGVDYYHVDGVFDRKAHTNRKEAEFIVDLIYQNIEKYPNRSLGVVAFSVAQQDLIDKLLSKRRQSTPEKEYFFKNDVKEPFFIKLRLLEAAADAVKNPTKSEVKSVDSQPAETFEEVAVEKHFEFPSYKAADFFEVCRRHHYRDFKAIVKEILEVEAPLSEDLFLKRIVWYFEREKVTNVVQRAYEQQMYGCQRYGIIRRNGFLYLDNGKEVQFRGPGDIERDIKQIAPEELAAGMFEILKQNVTADKSGLYRSLAAQCGVTRVGKAINEAMDAALNVLSDRIIIDDEQVSIK